MAAAVCSVFTTRGVKNSVSHHTNLLPRQGEVFFYPSFFAPRDADLLFESMVQNTAWRDDSIVLFGKKTPQPRRTAWYGDPGKSYTYSGLKMEPLPWTDELLQIKTKIELFIKRPFNSVLLNLYRHQKDSMGWHRDNEKELGPNPVIASVSFGATRTFCLRHYTDKKLKANVDLTHGSLLLMQGESQHFWEHALPKRTRELSPRLNLTFRQIL